jgi:putative acetyltransferase
VIGRSEVDGMGQPYPLLHMRLRQSQQRSSHG